MSIAIGVALVATLLGVALALLPAATRKLLGPIRTFALTASLAVVLVHLIPEGFAALGAKALVVFALGALLPIALSAGAERIWRRSTAARGRSLVALEAGYAGLLVHKLGDGIGLGAYAGPLGGDAQVDVMLALAAHTVPVVAVVVLAFESARGRVAALARAGGIALATVLGVLIAGAVPAGMVTGFSAWIAAGVSGLLLHVVMHDLTAHPPKGAGERTLDLAGALAGLAVPLLAAHWHGEAVHDAHELSRALSVSFVDLALDTAPMLLVGLFAGALIQTFGSKIPPSFLRTRGALADAVRGAVVGAPLPLCSCSVLPVSGALVPRAGPALVVAFLLATPELGIETFALSIRFLGWPFALVRLGGALAVAIVAGVVVARLAPPAPAASGEPALPDAHVHGGAVRRTLVAFDELLGHIGAWMVVGIAAAAAVEALIPAEAFGALGHPLLELAVVSMVAIPSYICAPSATPLAAVLIAKGLSPGAVLVGLLLGPATNLATIAFLRASYGTRATALALGAVVALSWVIGLGTNAFLPVVDLHAHSVVAHDAHGALAIAAGLLLLALLLRSVWLSGARAWLGSLAGIGGGHGHAHHHHEH